MTLPTDEQLRAARDRTVADVIASDLDVLFCGINPSLLTAVTGHHFAHPSNRFWSTLHEAGLTERRFDPSEQDALLEHGYGITNVVARATASAAELSREEFVESARVLEAKIEQYRPDWLAVLGLGAYRTAFGQRNAGVGPRSRTVGGARVWVLPNPSGLNAHYPPKKLARVFGEFRAAVEDAG